MIEKEECTLKADLRKWKRKQAFIPELDRLGNKHKIMTLIIRRGMKTTDLEYNTGT